MFPQNVFFLVEFYFQILFKTYMEIHMSLYFLFKSFMYGLEACFSSLLLIKRFPPLSGATSGAFGSSSSFHYTSNQWTRYAYQDRTDKPWLDILSFLPTDLDPIDFRMGVGPLMLPGFATWIGLISKFLVSIDRCGCKSIKNCLARESGQMRKEVWDRTQK